MAAELGPSGRVGRGATTASFHRDRNFVLGLCRRKPSNEPDHRLVEGVLKADGTLELDEKPCLAPGRVQVILHAIVASSPSVRGLAGTIAEIRQYQQARGYTALTPEAMAQHEELRRADENAYEDRMREIRSQARSGVSTGEP